jgi:DNA helicase-2/ATP-dependent DNA helicase PcrA
VRDQEEVALWAQADGMTRRHVSRRAHGLARARRAATADLIERMPKDRATSCKMRPMRLSAQDVQACAAETEPTPPVVEGLDPAQAQAVAATEGPVLLIAGPGTGKTLTLVRRTLHLLTAGLAKPGEIVLCTFTEKAALELRDRLRGAATAVGYQGDLSSLRSGTIHGVCNEFVDRYRHLTPLRNGYEVLDELTQSLFLFEHFDEVVGPADDTNKYLSRWSTKWTAIEGLRRYLDKLTEELVDVERLERSGQPFLVALAAAYRAYEAALVKENQVDFAHLEKFFLDLLDDPAVGSAVRESVRYVMVDEYQDTNYIQERLLARLSEATGNLCVVGDEDQSLYRFRGATVRNILEFPSTHPGATVIKLTINYRSHRSIVYSYDRFMKSADWSNPGGPPFRFDKSIEPDPDAAYPDYPAVLSIWGATHRDEATRFANLVAFLADERVIEDYSQVALLLHSVRTEHSGPYLEALDRAGIPYFCPRARAYFENEEVRAALGCLAVALGWYGDGRGTIRGRSLTSLARAVDDAIGELGRQYSDPHPLGKLIQRFVEEVASLDDTGSLDRRPADYLYELLAVEPFTTWLSSENRARNLATMSELLNVFQRYYHYSVITKGNLASLRLNLFNSFMRLLHEGGINEYEDPYQPFPKGHVQVMTIHQAKGLEFPVVVVGSLAAQLSSPKDLDHTLGPFYHRPTFEPEDRITAFDRMRLHYVGFSRAEKLLVLTSTETPKAHFDPIWQGLPQWPYVQKDLLAAQGFALKPRTAPKKSFSFTGDLKVYETCPRQYQMFRYYDFTPSRSAVIFFGLLVHQTIEDIHRLVLAGRLSEIDHQRIEALFEFNFRHLAKKDVRPIGEAAKQAALEHVLNYFSNNLTEMTRVIDTEVDVSLEKDNYILTGAVDLLLGDDGSLEVLDFKAQARPDASDPVIESYRSQLCIYGHILEERRGRRPDRLLLYWTGESTREHALMSFGYQPEVVALAIAHFDDIVADVQAQRFDVRRPPPPAICKECDFRAYCAATGTIDAKVIA